MLNVGIERVFYDSVQKRQTLNNRLSEISDWVEFTKINIVLVAQYQKI